MHFFLLGIAIFGLVTSTVFAGMVIAGARHHLRPNLQSPGANRSGEPALSLLKPLHGNEPGLAVNLASFFEQAYPPSRFEILFCACYDDDPGLVIARQVAAQYPEIKSRFFSTCDRNGEPKYINAKVHSLEVMATAAAHEIYVISDSDVRVTPDYLHAVAMPFEEPGIGAVTCLYRGVAIEGGIWSRLEAVGMSVEMTAGVLVANMLEGMQFVLGPTMAVRRESVQQMGGIGTLGDYCSDDYLLGNQVHLQGRKVALSHHVIDHIIINSGLVGSLKHQVRWMKSTRFSRPKGHLGTALTFSVPYGLLGMVTAIWSGHPGLAITLLTWSIASRLAIAWVTGHLVVKDPKTFDLLVLYPIRDLMGFGFWMTSYFSNRILWRGKTYSLLEGGKMREFQP
jgi:ceramide glucosyltransferase